MDRGTRILVLTGVLYILAIAVGGLFGCATTANLRHTARSSVSRTPVPRGREYRFQIRYEGEWCPDAVVWRWGAGEIATASTDAEIGECAQTVVVSHVFDRPYVPREIVVELYHRGAFVMDARCRWIENGGGTCIRGFWTIGRRD